MITWKDDKTFVEGNRIFQVDSKNEDGSMVSHMIGFTDKSLEKVYNETAITPLESKEIKDIEITEVAEPLVKEDKPKSEPKKFICQYCGRDCKANIGLVNHEPKCPENPNNKKGE